MKAHSCFLPCKRPRANSRLFKIKRKKAVIKHVKSKIIKALEFESEARAKRSLELRITVHENLAWGELAVAQ